MSNFLIRSVESFGAICAKCKKRCRSNWMIHDGKQFQKICEKCAHQINVEQAAMMRRLSDQVSSGNI